MVIQLRNLSKILSVSSYKPLVQEYSSRFLDVGLAMPRGMRHRPVKQNGNGGEVMAMMVERVGTRNCGIADRIEDRGSRVCMTGL